MPTQAEFLRAPLDTGSPLRLPSDLQQVCSFLDVAYTCRSSPGIVSALMIGLAMTGMSLECHTSCRPLLLSLQYCNGGCPYDLCDGHSTASLLAGVLPR